MTNKRNIQFEHFLIGKKEMLHSYEEAKEHSKGRRVQVEHGNVAEKVFRDWLKKFLLKRFGVTSGYIFSQDFQTEFQKQGLIHFDVIIYDQIESPVLWYGPPTIKKDQAIPAEHVMSVIEVKSTLNKGNLESGIEHLGKLKPLFGEHDTPGNHLKKFLPQNFFTHIVFFELEDKVKNLDNLLKSYIPKVAYRGYPSSTLILKKDNLSEEYTGILELNLFDEDFSELKTKQMKSATELWTFYCDNQIQIEYQDEPMYLGANLHWNVVNFSIFAFNMVSKLQGNYDSGKISSLHGWPKPVPLSEIL